MASETCRTSLTGLPQEGDEHFTAVADEDADGFFVLTAEGMSDMNGSTRGYCAVWMWIYPPSRQDKTRFHVSRYKREQRMGQFQLQPH